MPKLSIDQHQALVNNFHVNRQRIIRGLQEIDFYPVARLFTPDAQCTWLLTELDPDTNIAFGLCDLELGMPELGYVSLDELNSVRGLLGLPVEVDEFFLAKYPLSKYRAQMGH